MPNFGDYPPNIAPKDALVVRAQASAEHVVTAYSGEQLSRAALGPASPFAGGAGSGGLGLKKRKNNVLTGHAEETYVSEATFRAKYRAFEQASALMPEFSGGLSGKDVKKEARALRDMREGKGYATVADGPGAYVGPWARFKTEEYEEFEMEEDRELASDEEYVEVDEGAEVVASGAVVRGPEVSLKRRQEIEEQGPETTRFHGESEFDYQGRTYMHVPQDLDVDLRKEPGGTKNYIPKKHIFTWNHHPGASVTALRLFPRSSHLGLSGSSEGQVRLFDIYHNRELLRTFQGHNRAISDLAFNRDGTQFLSAAYDRSVKLWDTETGSCRQRFASGKTAFVARFNPGVAHAHEFLVGSNKKIYQYDSRAGNDPIQEYDYHLGPINTITYIEDGNRFVSTSDDKSLRVWEYGIPVPIKLIAEPDLFSLTRAALHPSGKYILYQSADNQVLLYSANDKFRQNRKKSFRGHNTAGSAIDLVCSPDGQFVASGDSHGYVAFWDYKTAKMYHKIQASQAPVHCLAWSEQETSKLLTAGSGSLIKLWD